MGWRKRLGDWTESHGFQVFINALILLNAITLGLETSPAVMHHTGRLILTLETIFLSVFVIEILLKLIAFGPRFFTSAWNIFDFTIVGISLIPAAGAFTVLRALRVLRILRLLKTIPRLRMIVEGTLRVLPDLGWVFLLMTLVFYVFAVIGTKLFAAEFPGFFGNIGRTMFTLFQVMTLESWSSGVARIVMERYPYAWVYFVAFILVASFLVLNMVIGVVVTGFQGVMQGAPHAPGVPPIPSHLPPMNVEAEIRSIQKKLDRLLMDRPDAHRHGIDTRNAPLPADSESL
jgi:voltage-gated sodium channel